MRKIVAVVVVLALLGAGVWWFTRGGASLPGSTSGIAEGSPLDFVPADTPYVVGVLEPLPAAERARWVSALDGMGAMWRMQIEIIRDKLGRDDADVEADARRILAWLDAIEAEFTGKTFEAALADIGASMDGRGAFYGIGLAPVARGELVDPDKFRAAIARIEQRAGETIPKSAIGGVDYWYVDIPETTLRVLFAIHGKHSVLTVGPSTDETALRTLLGIERPSRSLRDSGALQALNKQFGYHPLMSGYVDTVRVADLLTSESSPVEAALLAAMKIEKPAVDAACKTDALVLARLVPRISMGYTKIEGGHMDTVTRLETLPRIAADLQTLRTPMPGGASPAGAVFDMGFGLKASALPALLNGWADAAATYTFTCPELVDLNASAEGLRTAASNPGIYTVAPMASAVRLIATRVDMASLQSGTPDVSGKALIASDNPAALLSMAKNFMPELATFDLKPDGQVVALPALSSNPLPLPAFAAMSAQVLALGVGTDQQAALAGDLALDPSFQPLLVYGLDGAFYAQMMRFGMDQAALAASNDEEREEAQRMGSMMEEIYGKWLKHTTVTVDVDQHGLVVGQTMLMP